MPVHNGEPYVAAAIQSVLDQTLTDFELVIVENGSSDGSVDTLRAAAARDPRIRLIESPRALGVVGAAVAVVAAACAPLIARHDQDDLSHPDRLARQVAAMDAAPDAVAVGTLSEGIDPAGRRVRPRDRWRLLRRSPLPPFPHGSMCVRREVFDRVGGYREGTCLWEDIDLCLRLVREGPVLVLPDALYRSRFHPASAIASQTPAQRDAGPALLARCIEEFRRGADWTDLLGTAESAASPVAPWRLRNDTSLWSGDAPRTSSSGRGRLRQTWQARSPRTLRVAVRTALRLRDLAATPLVGRGEVVRWQPR
jgi:glycosyltransferase involved in cell wall biosynthesis